MEYSVSRYGRKYDVKTKVAECTKCGEIKKFSNFGNDKAGFLGISSACKVCENKWTGVTEIIDGLEYNLSPRGVRYNVTKGLKSCSICGEIKHRTKFTKQGGRGILGRAAMCNKCINKGKRYKIIDGIEYRVTSANTVYNSTLRTKKCSTCGEIKHVSKYHKGGSILSREANCKVCAKTKREVKLEKSGGTEVLTEEGRLRGLKNSSKYRAMNKDKMNKDHRRRSIKSKEELQDSYVLKRLRAIMNKSDNSVGISLTDCPTELLELKRKIMLVNRLINIRTNKLGVMNKSVKEAVTVTETVTKRVSNTAVVLGKFHNVAKVNKVLEGVLDQLVKKEPTLTLAKAIVITKVADTLINNSLVELKIQRSAQVLLVAGK